MHFFKVFNFAGWIIGGFSILVGGFGIANIMFVSVKERTKNYRNSKGPWSQKNISSCFSLFLKQWCFLWWEVFIGLILIFIGTLIFSYVADMTIALSMANIILGLTISGVIGILAGFISCPFCFTARSG